MYWLKYALPRPLIAVWEELTVVRSGQLPSGVVNSRQEWSALVSSRQLLSGVVSSRQEFSNFVRRCQFLPRFLMLKECHEFAKGKQIVQ